MDINRIKKDVEQCIKEKGEELWGLARYLWENPEYNFNEFKSSRAVSELLESDRFKVVKGICGLDTAFCGTADLLFSPGTMENVKQSFSEMRKKYE
ncbi:hypothetical protein [Lacrimispora sp.]|uniref:hypothetical protein n=1 Tax=Lacrimispora sp. TaxID=2719234 RepID=UPI00289D958C|nr:hypothetical protein [Lacrimispora sp.]